MPVTYPTTQIKLAAGSHVYPSPDAALPSMRRATYSRLYTNNFGTTTANAWTAIPLEAVQYDMGNNSNGVGYVCPFTGNYLVTGSFGAQGSAAGQSVQLAIQRNGSNVSQGNALQSGFNGSMLLIPSYCDILPASAGDVFDIAYFTPLALNWNSGIMMTWMSVVMMPS